MSKIGELRPIDIREVWTREDEDFTPWLFEQENLNRLAGVLNMNLKPIGIEVEVGQFYADILCRNTADNSLVVIENQLRGTDHKHLGQALTYAAGLKATTIIWISTVFTDEHCDVFDLLNAITNKNYKFFGVEIELWQIGDSLPAPIFNIVSKPNDINYTEKHDEPSVKRHNAFLKESEKQEFLLGLSKYMVRQNNLVQSGNPALKSYLQLHFGHKDFRIRVYPRFSNKNNENILIVLYISGKHATTYFHLLADKQQEIEKELGQSLGWDESHGKKYHSRIYLSADYGDLLDKTNWGNQYESIATILTRLKDIFVPYIKELNTEKKDMDKAVGSVKD